MELQLCLSLLPTTTTTTNNNNNNNNNNLPIVGIDLNHISNEGNNVCDHNYKFGSNINEAKISKRSFCQAFSEIESSCSRHRKKSKTLPLLPSNSPSDDDDEDQDREKNFFPCLVENNVDEEAGAVGWPPIKSWRRKRLCCDFAGRSDGNRTVENVCRCGERVSKFMYVKVKMEGVGIARKVDLSLHHCFDTLINTLLNMFGKFFENEDYYSLIYQDRKGHWFHTKDVSWRIFIRTVQRLKLVKRDRNH